MFIKNPNIIFLLQSINKMHRVSICICKKYARKKKKKKKEWRMHTLGSNIAETLFL